MRKALAALFSGLQGLGSDSARERPVDRLAAIGAIQIRRADEAAGQSQLASLGVDLIAYKIGGRELSRTEAEIKLADALKRKIPSLRRRETIRIARWTIHEWTEDACPMCHGACEIPSGEGVTVTCEDCHGSGRHKYTDPERVEAMGAAYSKAVYEAHWIIGEAESLAIRMYSGMLERWL